MKHILLIFAASLLIASCELFHDEKAVSMEKEESKETVVEEKVEDDEEFVKVPKEVVEMIADEMDDADDNESIDEDELMDIMLDDSVPKRKKDAYRIRIPKGFRRRLILFVYIEFNIPSFKDIKTDREIDS